MGMLSSLKFDYHNLDRETTFTKLDSIAVATSQRVK